VLQEKQQQERLNQAKGQKIDHPSESKP
jgi:hypothetical protein